MNERKNHSKGDDSASSPPLPQPPEEEIDLGSRGNAAVAQSGDRKPSDPTNQPQSDGPPHEDGPSMDARAGSLEQLLSPGMSDDDIVNAIIEAPEEKLIPWEFCKLPSKGLFYENWDVDGCEVKAMGQAAEKILATQRLAQSGQSIDYLFRECCRFPAGMDPLDLLVGDRVFLLYYLRGITHGNVYEFAVTCQRPDCGQVSIHIYNLNNLAKTIKWADANGGTEPFKVTLPYLSQSTNRDFWVGVRFLRGRDTNNMIAMRRTHKKLIAQPTVRAGQQRRMPRQQSELTIDDTLTENLQMVITSIMGKTDRMTINRFVPKMHATDTAAVREWLRESSPGIETTVTLNCPECGQEFMVELPITESFFRPSKAR